MFRILLFQSLFMMYRCQSETINGGGYWPGSGLASMHCDYDKNQEYYIRRDYLGIEYREPAYHYTECLQHCNESPTCLSVEFDKDSRVCWLVDQTIAENPEGFMKKWYHDVYEKKVSSCEERVEEPDLSCHWEPTYLHCLEFEHYSQLVYVGIIGLRFDLNLEQCFAECDRLGPLCLSVDFVERMRICRLNHKSLKELPNSLVDDDSYDHWERVNCD